MFSALGRFRRRSSKFETGAVAGLLERRKLCLRSANLRRAPQPGRAVLEMMLVTVSNGKPPWDAREDSDQGSAQSGVVMS
jgi:hypothetical protein